MIAQSLGQRGAMLRPYIVDQLVDEKGEVIYRAEPKYVAQTVNEETAQQLVRALRDTTTKGTARKSFRSRGGVPALRGIEVAGKTGTLNDQKPFRAYTWFLGIAPVEHPEIALAVLVVNGPVWKIKAPGLAVKLLKKYFDLSRRSSRSKALL